MVFIKNLTFFHLIILVKIGKKIVFFYDILDRKKSFLEYTKKDLKKLKNDIFSKRLVHGFDEKFEFFLFFLDKMGQENAFDDILHRKKGLSMRLPRTFTQAT